MKIENQEWIKLGKVYAVKDEQDYKEYLCNLYACEIVGTVHYLLTDDKQQYRVVEGKHYAQNNN